MKHGAHASRVVSSPWPGVFGTDIDSARHFGRYWHATFGFGLMERGAHRSLSGRGIVDAQAGDVAPVRERLAADLVGTPSLAELAASVGLNRYQLLRRFGPAPGPPPVRPAPFSGPVCNHVQDCRAPVVRR